MRLRRGCEGVQHLHRGVYPRAAGSHRAGDRCAAQNLKPLTGTVTSPPRKTTFFQDVFIQKLADIHLMLENTGKAE